MEQYLKHTPIMDFDNNAVSDFAQKNIGGATDSTEKAINLYYAVRDQIRYDPYTFTFTVEGLRASTTLAKGRAWCIPKAALLAACLRLHKIPARLGFADVRNHLSTTRMRELMKTDVFTWHGYTSIFLHNKWIKATPAFNIELCNKFNLIPLEFDGLNDSIYHPFDLNGNRHMDYIRFHGEFEDIPIEKIEASFRETYDSDLSFKAANFDKDVENEMGGDNK